MRISYVTGIGLQTLSAAVPWVAAWSLVCEEGVGEGDEGETIWSGVKVGVGSNIELSVLGTEVTGKSTWILIVGSILGVEMTKTG